MTATKKAIKSKDVYTTGEVAKICQVAPRTVSKWFDSGKLKGYRIPGSQDRRIPRGYLETFLRDNGFPTDLFDTQRHAVAITSDESILRCAKGTLCDFVIHEARNWFAAGLVCREWMPRASVLVIDTAMGKQESIQAIQSARDGDKDLGIFVVMGDDELEEVYLKAGANAAVKRSEDVANAMEVMV